MNRQESALLFCINAVALYIFLQRFNCVRSVRIRSYSGPYFTAFGLNTERHEVSLRIQSESGKIRTRTTPNTDNFYAVFIGSRFIDCIFFAYQHCVLEKYDYDNSQKLQQDIFEKGGFKFRFVHIDFTFPQKNSHYQRTFRASVLLTLLLFFTKAV